MDDLPSTERGPRQSDNESQTGTGMPRSADGTVRNKSQVTGDSGKASELRINRSGSGGSGGPSTAEEDAEGSNPASMDELLGEAAERESRG